MCPKNYMNLPFIWCKNLGGNFVRFVAIHACDGQTDGRTDRQTDTFAVGMTALDICSAVKISQDQPQLQLLSAHLVLSQRLLLRRMNVSKPMPKLPNC